MSFNLYIFVSFFFTLVYHMHFSRIIKESLLIHIFYVMALFVERKKNGVIFHSIPRVAYTFSLAEERLNQQLPTKEKGNGVN